MIKYFEFLNIFPKCKYIYKGKTFKSIGKAIDYAKMDKNHSMSMKSIMIINPKASNTIIPASGKTKFAMRHSLSKEAKYRTIDFSNNMDEIYIERFILESRDKKSNTNIYYSFVFDYNILDRIYKGYENVYELNGKTCISSILPYTFTLSSDTFGDDQKWDSLYMEDDIFLAYYNEYYAQFPDEYVKDNYGFKRNALPSSTMIEYDGEIISVPGYLDNVCDIYKPSLIKRILISLYLARYELYQ